MSAGDPSGDNAISLVMKSLLQKKPDTKFFGLGHDKLKALGQEQFVNGSRLAVLGFWEVFKQVLFFKKLMKQCASEIEKRHPKAVILVDYPGFNLRLAKRIKKLGIPIIYYISPQVWAWGKGRVQEIKELVDLLLVILPFEHDFFNGHNIKNEFVGHYLLEDIPSEYISSHPILENRQGLLCVLPGSRNQEVKRMLPPMLKAASMFTNKYNAKAVVAGIRGIYDYETALQPYKNDNIEVVYDKPRECIYKSNLLLTASGTATLETGIIARPMVVVYKTGFITYQIARRLVSLKNIALVNLVLNDNVVPELIQTEASPENMFKELSKFMDDSQYYKSVHEKLLRVSSTLGGTGSSERAADAILNFIRR
ncbi:MAG: lipid-A-disaccharide synthase [bacterium]